ncbi:MAG: hypothetical protein HQL54_05580 [Magnetococcales bacterium]|nr:hypothetical protein [Magnetococcales bacterium]
MSARRKRQLKKTAPFDRGFTKYYCGVLPEMGKLSLPFFETSRIHRYLMVNHQEVKMTPRQPDSHYDLQMIEEDTLSEKMMSRVQPINHGLPNNFSVAFDIYENGTYETSRENRDLFLHKDEILLLDAGIIDRDCSDINTPQFDFIPTE